MRSLLPSLLTALALAWLALLLAAPFAPRQALLVYEFGGRICHQRPERSFHLAGMPLPVCARCFGLYLSGALGAVAGMAAARRGSSPSRDRARLVFAAAAAPTVLTVALEWLGLAHPSNLARALAALPLGAAAGYIIVRMLLAEETDQPLRYHG